MLSVWGKKTTVSVTSENNANKTAEPPSLQGQPPLGECDASGQKTWGNEIASPVGEYSCLVNETYWGRRSAHESNAGPSSLGTPGCPSH